MFELLTPVREESRQSKKGITFYSSSVPVVGYDTSSMDNITVELN